MNEIKSLNGKSFAVSRATKADTAIAFAAAKLFLAVPGSITAGGGTGTGTGGGGSRLRRVEQNKLQLARARK